VFDVAGGKLFEARHCRDPKFTGERVLTCDGEQVGADGKLELKKRRIGVESGNDLM
jgi:hypothetical protein